jgi:hypothetical protein
VALTIDQTFQAQIIKIFIRNDCLVAGEINFINQFKTSAVLILPLCPLSQKLYPAPGRGLSR